MSPTWLAHGLATLAVLFLAVCPAPAADERLARVTLPGESAAVGRRLEAVRKLVAAKSYPEAIEEYQRLLETAGDDLVPLDVQHCVRARWLCHRDLAALPVEALQTYRGQADGPARKWLEEGLAKRDEALLRRVVYEAFCSRPGAGALEALGDLAFERGGFAEAERWWRLLVAPVSEKTPAETTLQLVYPGGSETDAARVRAKQLLAQLFQGNRSGFAAELTAFQERHGKEEGSLAGRTGKYADILQSLPRDAAALAGPPTADSWPTFAGKSARACLVPVHYPDRKWIYRLCQDGPTWRFDLEKHTPLDGPLPAAPPGQGVPSQAQLARQLAFQPVLTGDLVLVADARYVTAYNMATGASEVWYDLGRDNKVPSTNLKLPAPAHLRYSLTVAEGHVLTRLGAQGIRDLGDRNGEPDHQLAPFEKDSYLVCLALRPDLRGNRLRWLIRPAKLDNPVTVFEGAPLVHDGRVYVAATRFTGGQAVTAIHCYPLHTDRNPVPLPLWEQDVCSVHEERPFEPRYRHHLLTLAGPNVVYASHSGAVVAVDALTGRHAWSRRYPSRGPTLTADQPSPRDLAPCLYAGGRLYAAPLDSDRLLCLDPDTGCVLWERDRVEVVHLLGVGSGRLIFTMRYPGSLYDMARFAIRALDAATGSDDGGWMQPGDGSSLVPFGRGLLLGDLVLWPTERGLRALRQDTGEPPADLDDQPLRQVSAGNLAYADGCLAVAGSRELALYVAPARRLPERERRVKEEPQSSAAHYLLGEAEVDAGLPARAVASFGRAEQRATPSDRWRNTPLAERAHAGRHEALLDLARKQEGAGKRAEAVAALTEALHDSFPAPVRLEALRRLAVLWTSAGEPANAVAVWQASLDDSELRAARSVDGTGLPRTATFLATEAIDELIHHHGQGVYRRQETLAQAALATAETADKFDLLEEVLARYPQAEAAHAAAWQLLDKAERGGRPGVAASACRFLLRRTQDMGQQAALLGRLAVCYERQDCWEAARATWQRLAREHADRRLAALDAERPVREVVAERLRRADYQLPSAAAEGVQPPYQRLTEVALGPDEVLLDDQNSYRDGKAPILGARPRELVCRDALTGKVRWSRLVPCSPRWYARAADTILTGGPDGVAALRLEDGRLQWHYLAGSDSPLASFRQAGSRLFCLQDRRRLLALDVDTGDALWEAWAPAARVDPGEPDGRFAPCYGITSDTLVIQTSAGPFRVFDLANGNVRHDIRLSRDRPEAAQCRPPVYISDQYACVVADGGHVAAINLTSGRPHWVDAVEMPSTLGARWPQLLSDGTRLFVLLDRNFGQTLQRLDPATGKLLWEDEVVLSRHRLDPDAITFDMDAIYCADGEALRAWSLVDHRPLWEQTLAAPARTCTVRLTARPPLPGRLAVFRDLPPARRFQFRWPFGTIQWVVIELPPRDSFFCVSLHDRRTGQLDQRLNCGVRAEPALQARLSVWPSPQREGLDEKQEVSVGRPVVSLSARGGWIGVAHAAWLFTVREEER